MSDHGSFETDTTQRKLGPIWLSPGIAPRHVFTLFYASALTIAFVTALNLLHPYLLVEHLGMPTAGQGDFTGNLYVALELVTITLAIPLGLLSDRIGRRPVFVSGFFIIFAGLILTPQAESKEMYVLLRLITSAGIACCTTMIASTIADYPQNVSRGKMISFNGIFTALGIILIASFGLAQLPKLFGDRGFDPITAGTWTFWIGAVLALVSGLIVWAAIKGGRATTHEQHEPLREMLRTGLTEIYANPRLRLGCGATFLSRGDLTVFVTFFSLWIIAVGTDQRVDAAHAQATAGALFGVSQFAMLCFMPIMGMLVDRVDRVTTVSAAMALAAIGYFALGFAPDPFSSPMIYVVAVLAGIGEGAMIVSVPGLIGQEAPGRVRGSIMGVMALFGGLGILLNIKISGLLFDAWSYQAPFLFMGALNVLFMFWAVAVRVITGHSRHSERIPAAASTEVAT